MQDKSHTYYIISSDKQMRKNINPLSKYEKSEHKYKYGYRQRYIEKITIQSVFNLMTYQRYANKNNKFLHLIIKTAST